MLSEMLFLLRFYKTIGFGQVLLYAEIWHSQYDVVDFVLGFITFLKNNGYNDVI